MKRWLKRTLLMVLVLAISAGGTIAWFISTKSEIVSFNEVITTQSIDQGAREKYRVEQQAKAEASAKAAAEKAAKEAAKKAKASARNGKLVTYSVAVKGSPSSDLAEFKRLALETLNDSRGWVRAGVYFQEVASGGNFTLWLSEPGLVPSFAPSICSTKYSCSIGRNVIINNARWANASDSWNAAGGNLRNYRHMVINHEVGHFLGHRDNTIVCAGPGQPAPLMQQQSINLRGCTFNPWPIAAELWTNR